MKKFFSFLMTVFLLLLTIWIIGFIWFIGEVPRQSMYNSEQKADAEIGVVLTGASGRIVHGLVMLHQKRITKLFITGVDEDVSTSDLFTSAGGALGTRLYNAYKKHISIGKDARSTRGNAIETRKFLEHIPRDRRIIVITSNYHIPRSMHEFNRVFPDYDLVAEPIFSPKFPAEWWRQKNSSLLMVSEYNKFVVSFIAKYIARETKLSEILANNPL